MSYFRIIFEALSRAIGATFKTMALSGTSNFWPAFSVGLTTSLSNAVAQTAQNTCHLMNRNTLTLYLLNCFRVTCLIFICLYIYILTIKQCWCRKSTHFPTKGNDMVFYMVNNTFADVPATELYKASADMTWVWYQSSLHRTLLFVHGDIYVYKSLLIYNFFFWQSGYGNTVAVRSRLYLG